MNRLKCTVFFVSLFMLTACKEDKKEVEKAEKKPNIVFILVDDLGWKDLGCYGSSFYETPNLDRLASQSTLFTNAYTPNPVCSPTRAAIMTGKYPSRVGITDWIPGQDPQNRKLLGPDDLNELPLEELTFPEVLKDAGYKTFFAGKWHLGGEGFFPEDQGFEINKGGHHKGSPPGGYYAPYKNPKLKDGPEGEYLPNRLANESIQFLEENKDDPFLLYLSFYTVHTPIQKSKKHFAKFEKKRQVLKDSIAIKQSEGLGFTVQNQAGAAYASMVYAMDENVGKVLDKLDELGLTEKTLIIFTSDNGGLSTLENSQRTAPTSVKPLRAGKGWAYEGGIRVPLIIKSPGKNKQGKIDTPVISMDFYPTILDFVGLPTLPDQHVDGASLKDLLIQGKQLERDALLFHYPHYHGSGWKPGSAIRKGDWKLIHFYEDGRNELYNLKNDIGEHEDLAKEHPRKLEEMKEALQKMQSENRASAPSINNRPEH